MSEGCRITSYNVCYTKLLRTQIFGDEAIQGITAGDTDYKLDGVFVAIGTASASDFAIKMGVITSYSIHYTKLYEL